MSEINIGSYYVPIETLSLGEKRALLTPANKQDMPSRKEGWDFSWSYLWNNSDPEYQNIIKLSYNNEILGLVRYGLYQPPTTNNPNIKFLEIEQLEAKKNSRWEWGGRQRLVKPIGKWLIWYSVKVALEYGHRNKKNPLIILSSYPDAVDYYRDSIGMEILEEAPSCAPGEDLYGFRFLREEAVRFCKQQEERYGLPILTDSETSASGE